jgi:hypothetical protein
VSGCIRSRNDLIATHKRDRQINADQSLFDL